MGANGIPIKVWRCLGGVALGWLTSLFNKILQTKMMPGSWRMNTLVPNYKNKGEIQINLRWIKLMNLQQSCGRE